MNINEIKSKLEALQTQKNTSSSGSSSKNTFYRPTVGKEVIRMVPSKFNKSNPFSELYFHYGIHKFPMFSPINTGDKDPIVEFVKQLRETNDKENWRLARKLEPKMRVFVPVIVRGKEDEGVKLWGFGKEIYMELLSMVEDEDIGDYTDIITGRDLTLTTLDSTQTGTGYNKTTIRARTAQTPLAEDNNVVKSVLETQPDPMESFSKMEFDRMKEILHEYLAPGEEEADVPKPAVAFDTPSSPSNKFSLENQGKAKESKADKFTSLFDNATDDKLPF
tara:strand:+ start:2112 stop:2942 length:831 start_codon:yes stop_codon:yes gene_type:complete